MRSICLVGARFKLVRRPRFARCSYGYRLSPSRPDRWSGAATRSKRRARGVVFRRYVRGGESGSKSQTRDVTHRVVWRRCSPVYMENHPRRVSSAVSVYPLAQLHCTTIRCTQPVSGYPRGLSVPCPSRQPTRPSIHPRPERGAADSRHADRSRRPDLLVWPTGPRQGACGELATGKTFVCESACTGERGTDQMCSRRWRAIRTGRALIAWRRVCRCATIARVANVR
jgi:hypothetical protein